MGFWDKVRQRRLREKLMKGEFELTISGQYFMQYCRKIAAGVWTEKDYIYAYDEELMHLVNIYNTRKPESPISRENMARALLAFVGNNLAALREQAEREKGCEYCLQGEDLAYGLDSMQRTGRIYIDGNLLTSDLYSESMAVAVCFCPNCGKRLEERYETD